MEVRRLPIFGQYWQRLEAIPLPKTEESILLRVLVQLLVAVGIMATDVAAATQMSFWAIPLSLVGGIWSWYRRRDRNVTAKFLIAIGMILALIYFFENLFVSLNDTRLVLAELLIQLQVLHSFDLPRRKDLGYSMAIGLILLGVAGTISQTLAFAPFLLVFLAIALPILILDYRSRLGLEPEEFIFFPRQLRKGAAKRDSTQRRYSPLSGKRLAVFFLIIVALGLTLFAIMPRVPGYQLRTFPVSAPEQFQNQGFEGENRGIANPGYLQPGEEGTGSGGNGNSPSQGKGILDDTYYYGFNTQMNQNLRGTMTPKVVLRIRSQAPGFWRVLAFDRYTGQGWEVSRDQETQEIDRRSWSYRFWIPFPDAVSVETKPIIQSYTAVEDLPNLIPALSYPRYLYFPTPEIAVGPEGEMRSPLGLVQGLTYTVISEVPYRDRTELRTASQKYLPEITQHYFQVPPEIKEAVRQHTEELLGRSPQPLTNNYEKALYLAQALKQNYTIQPDLPFLEDNEDLVNAFLFNYKGGYPDHFATVYTIMLRSIGIPARLAVGFSPGNFNPFTGYYIVRNTDAHALTEVYFGRYGWFSFDPIPGHETVPLSFEESYQFSVLQQIWHWIAQWIPTPVSNFFGQFWDGVIRSFVRALSALWEFFSGSILGIFSGLIAVIGLAFLTWFGWVRGLSWYHQRQLAKLPPMEQLYRQMLAVLKGKGYPKDPAQTPLEYAQFASQDLQQVHSEIVHEISQAYVSWRYGEQIQNLDYLRQQFAALTRSLKRLSFQSLKPHL